jgi:glucoamylase
MFDERHSNVAQAQAPVTGARARRKRTGLDCAFLLAMVHANGRASDLASGEPKLNLLDDSVLATLREYVKSFEGLYKINKGKAWKDGWAVGRYAEDVYNGVGVSRGNPW